MINNLQRAIVLDPLTISEETDDPDDAFYCRWRWQDRQTFWLRAISDQAYFKEARSLATNCERSRLLFDSNQGSAQINNERRAPC